MEYSNKDIERWKISLHDDRAFYIPKLFQYLKTGDNIRRLSQVSMHLKDEARVAVAEHHYDKALGYLRESVHADMLFCQRYLTNGAHDSGMLESVEQMGFGPAFVACAVDRELARRAVKRYRRCRESVKYPKYNLTIGTVLCDLICDGRHNCDSTPTVDDFGQFLTMALAINSKDEAMFLSGLQEGIEDWRITNKREGLKGFPETVYYLSGVCMVKLARWIWDRDFRVDSEYVPDGMFDAIPAEVEFVVPIE